MINQKINIFGLIWIILVFVSTTLLRDANYSTSLWPHVAKSIGSLKRLKQPKPRYGRSPFSLICSLFLKDLSFILISYKKASSCTSYICHYSFIILQIKSEKTNNINRVYHLIKSRFHQFEITLFYKYVVQFPFKVL